MQNQRKPKETSEDQDGVALKLKKNKYISTSIKLAGGTGGGIALYKLIGLFPDPFQAALWVIVVMLAFAILPYCSRCLKETVDVWRSSG